jgi:hypothetical protein
VSTRIGVSYLTGMTVALGLTLNRHACKVVPVSNRAEGTADMDILATMTPEEYRAVRAQLSREDLWNVSGNLVQEARSNRRAEEVLAGLR